jgi:hypothetical protein
MSASPRFVGAIGATSIAVQSRKITSWLRSRNSATAQRAGCCSLSIAGLARSACGMEYIYIVSIVPVLRAHSCAFCSDISAFFARVRNSRVLQETSMFVAGWGTRIRSSQPRNLRNTTTFDPATVLVGALWERVKTSKSVCTHKIPRTNRCGFSPTAP